MALNWTPEVIVDFAVGTIGLLGTIISIRSPKTHKIKSFTYLKLAYLCYVLVFFSEGLSFLLLNVTLGRLDGIFSILAMYFLIISIDYVMKEKISLLKIVIITISGSFAIFSAFDSNAVEIVLEDGYLTLLWRGMFSIFGNLSFFIFGFYYFIWAFKTWKFAPYEIKSAANMFLLGGIITIPFGLSLYIVSFFIPFFIYITDVVIISGGIITFISFTKEPKIMYVLPFKAYRLIVKDKSGYPLFNHNWTKSEINETIFSGILTTIQQLSNDVVKIGEITDIRLKRGIIIFYETKLISVGLIVSDSSKFLRESLKKFSEDFELKFEKNLKLTVREMEKFESGIELINRYFSTIPTRIISSTKQDLVLSSSEVKIQNGEKTKLKEILSDEVEYNSVLSELYNAPEGTIQEFLKLYYELSEEDEL